MYVIKQHIYPFAPRYVAAHSFVPGVPTEWCDTIRNARIVGSKGLASLYVVDIPDSIYLKVDCVLALEGEEKTYYIEKIIGPHTVSWTDEIEKAIKMDLESARELMRQYNANIMVVES